MPVSPITITAASISNTNVSGALHVDTTQAKAGETSTITVTATDPNNQHDLDERFVVTVGAYTGPSSPSINYRPFANAVTQT